ncbi:MAG: CheY-like chemotaxis protein, partial [Cognaticolwellia sp.]
TAVLFAEPELLTNCCAVNPEVHCVALQRLNTEPQQKCNRTLALPIRPRSLWRSLTQNEEPAVPEALPPILVKILVVDDHSGNRHVMRDMLESLGATVQLAHSAKEALEMLKAQAVHLVFMDIDMPEMTGLQATERLRADGFGATIIGLSGHATSSARRAALDAGMDDYVTKPVRLAKLREVMDSVVPV